MRFLFLFCPLFVFAQSFDLQGHRGCRGLMPENTIPAFIKAVDIGVVTLELDLAVSKDSQLMVSHDPWIDESICSCTERIPIQSLTVAEIQQFDCGNKANARFPNQQKMIVGKPLFQKVVDTVESYLSTKQLPSVKFNIEIKSKPEWDNHYTPSVNCFAKMVVDFIHHQKHPSLFCVQSFDARALEEIHRLDSTIVTAWLFALPNGWKTGFKTLSFRPTIMSPNYLVTRKTNVLQAHRLGITVIPWTVNEEKEMKRMLALKVDGIITDYPDVLKALLK
jgi:glycerophosphoryl diester phosphodiesterase